MKAGALAVGGLTVAAGIAAKSTLDIGVTYQNSLNTLQAVSSATASQMAAVGRTAKALGSDMSLPATSAADAAAAMTELAKAGFTVEQSQTAAKGSLQLAAAAQIDAATAANIQAGALNAFNLEADQAGHVADVLANSANASAAEITDVADALAQGGSVAHTAKVPIEDFAAAVGILANNSIKGSDAGTLLKSMILALQSPSGPAEKAMTALGLSAYDAQGNFVGLASIFGDLDEAQQNLTQQAFDQATSTLFGSDAARIAGIAATEGAEGFEKMAEKMGTAGAAADVSAAKSKGVGGAIEALKSQIETFQIDVFERGAPNIEKLVRYAAENFPKVGNALIDGGEEALAFLSDLKDRGVETFKDISDYLEPVTSELDDFWHGLTEANGPADAFFGTLKVGGGIVLDVLDAVHPLVSLGGEVLDLFNKLPGPVKSVVIALAALKVATSVDFFGKLAGQGGVVGGVTSAMTTASSSVVGFAQTVRTNMSLAGEDVGRMEKVTGGFSAAFGTYMPNATRNVTNFTGSLRSAFDQAKGLQRFNVAQMFGTEALSKSTGDLAGFTAAAKNAATQGIGGMRSAAGGLVGFMGGPWGVALAAGAVAVGLITDHMQKAQQQTAAWTQAILEGGQAARELQAQAARNSSGWFDSLTDAGQFGDQTSMFEQMFGSDDNERWAEAQKAANDFYKSLSPLGKAQADVTRETNDLADAVTIYGKNSPEAAYASRTYQYAQRELATAQGAVAEATKTATQRIQEQTNAALAGTNANVAASQAQTTLERAEAATAETLAHYGATSLEGREATDNLASAAINAANAAAAQAAAHSLATDATGKQKDADAALLASLQATATQLGEATPQAIKDLIASLSASAGAGAQTASTMRDLGLSVTEIPGAKYVQIDAPTAKQKSDIEALGYSVTTLPDGTVVVSANTGPAYSEINALLTQKWTAIIDVQTRGTSGSAATIQQAKANIEYQERTNRATGGPIFGPGTSTSDSIAAFLSNGEYVIQAKSVAKYGHSFFDAVNAGRFAGGGAVGQRREPALVGVSAPLRPAASPAAGPLIGVVNFNGSNDRPRDQLAELAFTLRKLNRGGRRW
jgi:TP901 family phage tail tape measure protein